MVVWSHEERTHDKINKCGISGKYDHGEQTEVVRTWEEEEILDTLTRMTYTWLQERGS